MMRRRYSKVLMTIVLAATLALFAAGCARRGMRAAEAPEPPAKLSDVSLLQWNLASLDRTSLAPGETLRIEVTYGQEDGLVCGFAAFGLAVQATVGGREQLHGSQVQQSWGNCETGGQGGGGELAPSSPATGGGQGVSAPPKTGDGAGRKEASFGAPIEAFAVAGALLMSLGYAVARRVRL